MNKVLNYKFFPRRKAITLSNLATLLVKSHFPEVHRDYLSMNYMQTNEYTGNKNPFFQSIYQSIYKIDPGQLFFIVWKENQSLCLLTWYEVFLKSKKSESITYTVSFGFTTNDKMPFCSCPDWIKWHIYHASTILLSLVYILLRIGTSYHRHT